MDRSSMVDRSRMVDRSSMMDRSRMMERSNMMNWSVMRINMNRNRFSILIQFWFRIVRVLVWIRIQFIQGNSLAAVNLVPKLTSKLVLIKQGTIRADKPCTRGTISSIITHSVCLASRVCNDGRDGPSGAGFVCPNGTLFDQYQFACEFW